MPVLALAMAHSAEEVALGPAADAGLRVGGDIGRVDHAKGRLQSVAARKRDDIGLAVSEVHVNPAYGKNAALTNVANGVEDYDDPAYLPVQEAEYNAELNYGIHVTDWLTVRPNLQFVRHPDGVKEVDDAWAGGLKVQATF